MSPVVCYRLQRHELDTLAKGPAGTMLAFGSSFLFSGLSLLGSVFSGPMTITQPSPVPGVTLEPHVPPRVIVLLVLTAVCVVLGVVLLFLWWAQRNEVKKILDDIHARETAAGTKLGTAQPSAGAP